MRAFGAPADQIERMQQTLQERKPPKSEDPSTDGFGVWADNWDAAQAWCGIETQWRTAGMDGVPTGLDYTAVFAWLDRFVERGDHKQIMDSIQVMERAALTAMAELREKKQGG